MDPTYAARYRELYNSHWWWRARETLILETLERIAPAGGFGNILDIGCGDGLFFEQLRRFGAPHGIETDAELVTEHGRARGPIHIGTLESYRSSAGFGLITLLDVVEHVENDAAFLHAAAELLAPGGHIVVTAPAFQALWTQHDDMNHHYRRYTKRTVRELATRANLLVDQVRYFFLWLALPKFALHLASRPGRNNDLPVPTIPPRPINRILAAASRCEAKLLGQHAPFGSSVLMVARLPPGRGCPTP